MPFHYDPGHDDDRRDRLHAEARALLPPSCELLPAHEGDVVDLLG
jgi:hypothetical protein